MIISQPSISARQSDDISSLFSEKQAHLSRNLRATEQARAVSEYLGCSLTGGAILLDAGSQIQDATCYSRNRNTYTARRYHGDISTCQKVIDGVEELANKSIVNHFQQARGLDSIGKQSQFTLTDCAWDILTDVWDGGLIPKTPPKEHMILRDSNKQYIDYTDTREIVRSRGKLQEYNEHLKGVTISAPNRTGDISIADMGEMVRIFNNSDFKQGGRSYASWQNQAKEDRARMLIDGSPMIELDYDAMHPTMLYTREGLKTPQECYYIDGIDRWKVKLALLILINADSSRKATYALAEKLYKKDHNGAGVPDGEDIPKAYTSEASLINKAVKKLHKPIAKYFNSGVGLELQNIDARIAESVWWWMHKHNIIVLPVHDSFVVRVQHADLLESIMLQASEKIAGRAIQVSRSSDN